MDALSVHLGLQEPLRVAFSLSPLLVAIAAYVWLGMKFRKQRRGNNSTCAEGNDRMGDFRSLL